MIHCRPFRVPRLMSSSRRSRPCATDIAASSTPWTVPLNCRRWAVSTRFFEDPKKRVETAQRRQFKGTVHGVELAAISVAHGLDLRDELINRGTRNGRQWIIGRSDGCGLIEVRDIAVAVLANGLREPLCFVNPGFELLHELGTVG